MKVIFWVSLIFIVHSFIGYPISLILLNKIIKKDKIRIKEKFEPKVSIIIPAHNEELVIEEKLENLLELDYKESKLEIIVASDNSTDNTNEIVNKIKNRKNKYKIKLYEVKERKGKTNAQNEAVKISKGDIIIFSDANSILKNNVVKELVKYFADDSISYVSGKLVYINGNISEASGAENSYWNYDLMMRGIESDIASITAGNGAIYGVRKSDYINIDPIYCHDSMFPIRFAIEGKKAKYNKNAIAYEKAGETSGDEFKRKVRMARKNINISYSHLEKYNPIKTGWFSYFYFSHRYLRNSLFIFHILAYLSNLILIKINIMYFYLFCMQTLFYFLALIGKKLKIKLVYFPYYYSMTLLAQIKGAINELTGKSKAFWEKAESTR